ncbi:MAG: DsbC family protein [Deltaproteobacteria bacterium]|nr:DsbC family protein [Deltaproteobacteria bacterium]
MRWTLPLRALPLLLLLGAPALAFDPAQCGPKPCAECHKLTVEEAGQLLKGMVEGVTAVREGDIKGFWKVEVTNRGRTIPVYLDYAKRHLMANPMILRVETAKIPLEDAVIVGKADAPLKIIVFDDPECPYCQKLQPEMKKVVEARPEVAFHIKLYPLEIHPKAKEKAKAIVCEKSLQLLEDSLAGKDLPPAKCETKAVDETIRLARDLGINSTPTLIMPDGRLRPGYLAAEKILELLPQPSPGQK